MDETFMEKLIHFLIFAAICAGVVWLGWEEPLSYRFKSESELTKLRNPEADMIRPEATPWFDEKKWGSSLDKPAERVVEGPGKRR